MRWPRGNSFGVFTLGAFGLLLWLVAQFIALGLAGGGHGWNSPDIISLPLALVYPATLICAFHPGRITMKLGIVFAAIAVASDAFLLWRLFSEEYLYFLKIPPFGILETIFVFAPLVAIWLALWVGWQVLIFGMLQKQAGATVQGDVTSPQSRMGWMDKLLAILAITCAVGIALNAVIWFGWLP